MLFICSSRETEKVNNFPKAHTRLDYHRSPVHLWTCRISVGRGKISPPEVQISSHCLFSAFEGRSLLAQNSRSESQVSAFMQPVFIVYNFHFYLEEKHSDSTPSAKNVLTALASFSVHVDSAFTTCDLLCKVELSTWCYWAFQACCTVMLRHNNNRAKYSIEDSYCFFLFFKMKFLPLPMAPETYSQPSSQNDFF